MMREKEKNLPNDFGNTTIPVKSEEVVEDTNIKIGTTLNSEMEKIVLKSLMDVIQKLNPDAEIVCEENIIFSDNPEKLKLPKGFYFSDINGITNKHIEQSGIFVSINVYPLKYHPNFN